MYIYIYIHIGGGGERGVHCKRQCFKHVGLLTPRAPYCKPQCFKKVIILRTRAILLQLHTVSNKCFGDGRNKRKRSLTTLYDHLGVCMPSNPCSALSG